VAGAFDVSAQQAYTEDAPAAPIVRLLAIPARSKTGRVILLAVGVLVLAVSVRVGYELSRIAKPQHAVAEAPPAETPPTPVVSVAPEPAKPTAPEPEPAKTPAVVAAVKPPPKPEPRPPEPSRPVPTFAKDVQPIVTAKCVTCHGRDNKKKGGLDLRSLAALHKGGESGQVVVGGQLDKSPLWESVDNGTMPPGKVKLTGSEKDMLRRWIEAGAK
jgi:hypothetical protein